MTALPRWDTTDVFASLTAREFVDALESLGADAQRAVAMFDELGITSDVEAHVATSADGAAAERALPALNAVLERMRTLRATVHATVSTNSTEEHAQALATRIASIDALVAPLSGRLGGWAAQIGVGALAGSSDEVAQHAGPLAQMARRAAHQMPDAHEGLYAALRVDASSVWARLHSDVTSQLTACVVLASGESALPIAAVRGSATDPDRAVRRAAYDAEMATWPSVGTVCVER